MPVLSSQGSTYGSLRFSSTANAALASGQYDAWFLFDEGYTPLAGPVAIGI